MIAERNVPLQSCNSFGIVARAQTLVRVRQPADVQAVLDDPELGPAPKFVLGGGSNIVLTGDVRPVVLKVELTGRRLVADTPKAWIVEAGAGENWHDFVAWTLEQGWPGLENLAMIPGMVGASPVQNIGAYGVEVQDRFESLDAVDLTTGQAFTLDAAQCAFGYRDSIFKHASSGPNGLGLAGKALILRVRFDPARQATRPGGHRQRRQLLQEPDRHARTVRRHHRPRPQGGALPDARRQHQARRGLADRCLRLEGQERRPSGGL